VLWLANLKVAKGNGWIFVIILLFAAMSKFIVIFSKAQATVIQAF
jgi:hypothetical protein